MLTREVAMSDAVVSADEETRVASRADKLSSGLSLSMSKSVPALSREEITMPTTTTTNASVREGVNNNSSTTTTTVILPSNMVKLNVYDITEANALLASYGLGVHHLAVEVYEMEVAYGRGMSGPGVFTITPRQCEPHMFREQYLLGLSPLSKDAVQRVVERLTCDATWAATAYHLLHHNCHHFAEHLCALLLPPSTRQAQQSPTPQRVREGSLYRSLWTEQVAIESGTGSSSSSYYTLPVLVPPHLTRICRMAASCLPQRAIDKLEELDRRSCVS